MILKTPVILPPPNLSHTESTVLVPRMHSANTVLCLPYAYTYKLSVSFVIDVFALLIILKKQILTVIQVSPILSCTLSLETKYLALY